MTHNQNNNNHLHAPGWTRRGFIWPRDRPAHRRGFRSSFLDILRGKGPDMYIADYRGPVLDWVDWARYPEFGPWPWRYDDSRKTPPWARRGDQTYDPVRRKYVRRLPIGAENPWPWPEPGLALQGWDEQQQFLQQQQMMGGNLGPWGAVGGGGSFGGFAAPHFRDPFSKGGKDEHLWYPPGNAHGGNVGARYPLAQGHPHPMSFFPGGAGPGRGRGLPQPRNGDVVRARRPRKNMPATWKEAMNDFRPAIVNGKNRDNWIWNPQHLMHPKMQPGFAGRYPHHGRRRHRRRSSTSDSDTDSFSSDDEWMSSDAGSLDSIPRRAPWHRRRR